MPNVKWMPLYENGDLVTSSTLLFFVRMLTQVYKAIIFLFLFGRFDDLVKFNYEGKMFILHVMTSGSNKKQVWSLFNQ